MTEWIQFGGLFLAVTGLCFIVAALVLRRSDRKDSRLDLAEEDERAKPNLVVGAFSMALSESKPAQSPANVDLQNELRSAGFYRPTAVVEYWAVRNLLVVIALFISAIIALLVRTEQTVNVLVGGLVLTGLAFSLPRVYLAVRGRARSQAIERGLPLAIDLLILCLSAGQNLLQALLQAARQLRKTNPVLAQELTIAHQQAELHSLGHALKQWGERVRLPEVKNLVMLLTQSEKLGADAAVTLSELANNFRITARQRAEAQANRTSFWMLFPSVMCFWVAAAIILVGPAYLEYFQYQKHASGLFNNPQQTIEKANRPGQPEVSPARGSPGQNQDGTIP
jgi:tight adherence protein C